MKIVTYRHSARKSHRRWDWDFWFSMYDRRVSPWSIQWDCDQEWDSLLQKIEWMSIVICDGVYVQAKNHQFLSDFKNKWLAPFQWRHPNSKLGVGVRTMGLFPWHAHDQGSYGLHRTINSFVLWQLWLLTIERKFKSYAEMSTSFVSYSSSTLPHSTALKYVLHFN